MSGVVVERAGLVESVHRVHVAVVDSEGRLAAGVGNAERVVFHRSAAKPFQAIPLVGDKGDERFGTALGDAVGGRLFRKTGTEGVFAVGATDVSFGIVAKVEDGGRRATPVVVLHVLDSIEDERLNAFRASGVTNTLGENVGVIRADFRLERHG